MGMSPGCLGTRPATWSPDDGGGTEMETHPRGEGGGISEEAIRQRAHETSSPNGFTIRLVAGRTR